MGFFVIDPASPGNDAMKYKIFGGGDMSIEQKLAQYKGVVGWEYLAPHYENGVLYFVDPVLDLESVGAAFSENDAAKVEGWLKQGDLVKIESLHAHQWEGTATEFEALVVSPFVLCRPVN